MDPLAVIPSLMKNMPGIQEAYHKISFECYRKTKAGSHQKVLVEILDAGPDAGESRYMCVAAAEDGRQASGNPAHSIEVVLAIVHWGDLDREI